MAATQHNRFQRPCRTRRGAGRGQSLTELALFAPLLSIVLLGVVELSAAYGTAMNVQSATAQAARIGALEGTNATVDADMLKAVLKAPGLSPANIQQIQIYRAAPDGSVDISGTTALADTYTLAGTTPITTTYNWPPSMRNVSEPADSLGVHITYLYHPLAPLFGRASIPIDDQTVQRLNPLPGAMPCPVPGIPLNIAAQVAGPQPPPNSSDIISWDPVPGTTTYNVYANVNGAGWSATPVVTVTGNIPAGRVQVTYSGNTTHAPTAYAVTGSNYCGEGQRSMSVPNNQCVLPITPTITLAAQAIAPATDRLTWNAPWASVPVSGTYLITQTSSSPAAVSTAVVPIASTNTTMPSTGHDPISYTMSAVTGCGVVGAPAALVTRVPAPTATSTPTNTATATATSTPTNTATATATSTPTNTATATATTTPVTTTLDDTSSQLVYAGAGWQHCDSSTCGTGSFASVPSGLYQGTLHFDNTITDTMTITFTGTNIALYSAKSSSGGTANVAIDGGAPTSVSFVPVAPATAAGNQLVWASPTLAWKSHTLTLTATGSGYTGVDRIDYR